MPDKIDDLLYDSGLIAQGCWDEMDNYDHEAIQRLIKLVAEECMDTIIHNRKYAIQHKWSAVELANVCVYEIEKTFKVNENGKETVSG